MVAFLLITISALLLQAAFMWPAHCAWMIFVFLIPLLYAIARFSLKYYFLLGLWWGVVFFTGHFWAALIVLYEKAHGPFRLVAGIILIFYCALYAGLWFSLAVQISRNYSLQLKLLFWGAGAWLYFYWLSNFIFWPCGTLVGYCFGSPLIVLAQYPCMLLSLHFLGSSLLTGFLIGGQISITFFILTLQQRYALIPLLCAAPFCIGFFQSHKKLIIPDYVSTLCYVEPPPKSLNNPLERAQEINARIVQALHNKPSAQCVLMPESSFTCPLNKHSEVLELWGVNSLAQGHILCIGSYRADTLYEYNSLYVLRDCRITEYYDKSNLMPFAEYLPRFGKKVSWIRNLFLKSQGEFSPRKGICKSIVLTDTLSITPSICSDIFMEPYMQEIKYKENIPILFSVNDSWFSMQYAKRLMALYAIYYAMKYAKDILYVGHMYGCWINHSTGKTILF